MRKLPKSFFWIDQQVVRNGIWVKLSCQARLAYVSIAASCDRDGLSIWSRSKLMELSGIQDPDHWSQHIGELDGHKLIELLPANSPPAIRLLSLESSENGAVRSEPVPRSQNTQPPIVIHTHTSIHLSGEKVSHVDSGNSG